MRYLSLCIKNSLLLHPNRRPLLLYNLLRPSMAAMPKLPHFNVFGSQIKESPLLGSNLIQPKLKDPQFAQFDLKLNRSKNGSLLQVVKAQRESSPDHNLDKEFYILELTLRKPRPWHLKRISSILLEMGIEEVTVTDVKGFGARGRFSEWHPSDEFSEDLIVTVIKMEITVRENQVQAVLDKIAEAVRIGDWYS